MQERIGIDAAMPRGPSCSPQRKWNKGSVVVGVIFDGTPRLRVAMADTSALKGLPYQYIGVQICTKVDYGPFGVAGCAGYA